MPAAALLAVAREMEEGLVDADLVGGLMKKRIARAGHGKNGGYHTLVATNRDDRRVFVSGFPKNVRSNIEKDEEEAPKLLATELRGLTPEGLGQAVTEGSLIEVDDAQNQV